MGGQHGMAAGEGEAYRLAPEALPDGLAHEASRRFLVAEGLPGDAADLDFGVLGEGGELEVFDDEGRLFVIGETGYCGSRVVVDGVTGQVYLACWRVGDLCRDVLASDLTALAGLIREVESLSSVLGEGARHGESRGPAAVAEVVEAAERRMRAVDPKLFDAGVPVAHWGTAVMVRSLRWGARPGGADELAYVLGPELVEDLAVLTGQGTVRRFHLEELPAGLVHEPTRRLLTEAGLPLDGEAFGAHDAPLRTMGEAHPEEFADATADRAYQRDFFAVGWWPHDLEIALDGATGRLELPDWYDDGEPHAYLNRDLSALLYALWTHGRMRAEWYRWEYGGDGDASAWEVFDPRALLHSHIDAMVKAIDPEAFATPTHSWRSLAEDDYTGGLLS
ncbi:SUKH-4 family immunity protein [Streptomyces cinnamoneus]